MSIISRTRLSAFACLAVLLITGIMVTSARAANLHRGSALRHSPNISEGGPGEVLWLYYETTEPFVVCAGPEPDGCNHGGNGDNVIRLVNPNGAANPEFGNDNSVCAMIYVFDDDQEMGECCGCPLTSAGSETFSVENLTSNWAIAGGREHGDHSNGAIAIVAAAQNLALIGTSNGHFCTASQSQACNFGCDPTNLPGYSVTSANNLLGSITHNQIVQAGPPDTTSEISNITEVQLFDDASGDPNNLNYLTVQCGALVGNSSGGGVCDCSEILGVTSTE
jgi:hypothetical protein